MTNEPDILETILTQTFTEIDLGLGVHTTGLTVREVGSVKSVSNGIAVVTGLPGAGNEELLKFPGELYGIAFNLEEDEIGVVLLGEYQHLNSGDAVERTGRVVDVPVGDTLIGRMVGPLGNPLDGGAPLPQHTKLPIERPAPAIVDRDPITEPLQTGVKVIDTLIPVGRGQRELILGDRQTGKTTLAIDTILNQKDKGMICVYCSIGQRGSSIAKVLATLTERGAMEYTVAVITKGDDPPGLTYICPYAATSIAEYFMAQGKDVLIVYDDLTNHARAYRELSLLLRRPPGREAFPGDIFFIHSRLLERSTHLAKERGGGSLTALPIIETEAQNMSAYIPTNLISITDGQIYLSPKLFELGILPAVDSGRSVSRVGGKAQRKSYRTVAGNLKLAFAQYEELEVFSRFGTRLDDRTKQIIAHGQRIRACLMQPEFEPVPMQEQILLLMALNDGLFDTIPLGQMREAEFAVRGTISIVPEELVKHLDSEKGISGEDREIMLKVVREAVDEFMTTQKSRAHE